MLSAGRKLGGKKMVSSREVASASAAHHLFASLPFPVLVYFLMCELKPQREAVESVFYCDRRLKVLPTDFCAMKGAQPSFGGKTSN